MGAWLVRHGHAVRYDQLNRGRYFFADIVREGVLLYDTPSAKLHKPADLKARVALEEAEKHYEKWMTSAAGAQSGAKFYIEAGDGNWAAFLLHQSAEHLYHCALLVVTLYSGKAHNLAFLRKKAEALDPRLAEAWPRDTKFERRCFELLRGRGTGLALPARRGAARPHHRNLRRAHDRAESRRSCGLLAACDAREAGERPILAQR